jgi:hypothetical protein
MSAIPSLSIRRLPTAIYYRKRANFWREKVATTPEADPQRALYLEVAKSYEKLAASYELQRAQPPIKDLMTSSAD